MVRAREAEERPEQFLASIKRPVILDEVQYAPSLFRELKILVDQERDVVGQWILTGSQRFHLMKDVSESLAGRIGILHLETCSVTELRHCEATAPHLGDILWRGGFPELWAHPRIAPTQFFEDYVNTYLERDLRVLINVVNLREYQRFVAACAFRVGQLVNFSELAKEIGVTAVTVKAWLSALEASGLIVLLQPFFKNLGKRLVKSPKLYFSDQGLLCYFLNVKSGSELKGHIREDQIFENFVFTELVKSRQLKPGRDLFFYRDQNGVEIDFLVDHQNKIELIEAKNTERIDDRKLNFAKVTRLFSEPVECQVACRIKEKGLISFKDYSIYNPLFI